MNTNSVLQYSQRQLIRLELKLTTTSIFLALLCDLKRVEKKLYKSCPELFSWVSVFIFSNELCRGINYA